MSLRIREGWIGSRGRGTRLVTAATALITLAIASGPYASNAHGEPRRFDGHQLVKVRVVDEQQLETILALDAASADFDIWSEGVGVGVGDIRVSPEQKTLLDATGLYYRVVIEDIQAYLAAERSGLPGFFDDFRTYEEHVAFLNGLAAARPDIAQVFSLGKSIEGRDIWAIRITGPGTSKPGVLYHGCQHAREWLTPPIISYVAEHLVNNYGTDPWVTTLVDHVEWFLVPISNPDGYVYTWTDDRFWRKNRRNNGDGTFGVDINRNWGYAWGGAGSSGVTGSEVYRGPQAFSEPETRALRNLILNQPGVRGHMDVHTVGNMLMWPWGYLSSVTPDHPTFTALGSIMARLIAGVHGTEYQTGTICNTIYQVSGDSCDWVYGAEGRWAFTIEARGPGFAPPSSSIMPASQENSPGLVYLAAWAAACDPHGFATGLAMAPDAFSDCDDDGNPDVCELADGSATDCNGNMVPDQCDITEGASGDCDLDGLPDECETDCNYNAVADICEVLTGAAEDCNANGVPDECDFPCGPPVGSCPGEGDCLDPDGNGTPGCDCANCCHAVCLQDPFCCMYWWDSLCAWLASYQPACLGGAPYGESKDCNANAVPDECDLTAQTSHDCNANSRPDECDFQDMDTNASNACEGATWACPGITYAGNTASSTNDGSATCGLSQLSPDVWYRYTAQTTGMLTVSVCGSFCNAVLSVHTGCPGSGENQVVCKSNVCGWPCAVTIPVSPGIVYRIRIGGSYGATGLFQMLLTGPPNIVPCLASSDCNMNFKPDECEPQDDCDGNEVADICEIYSCGDPIGSCPGEGDCCDPAANGSPGCNCARCCHAVCQWYPECCAADGEWDSFCALIASVDPQCDCGGLNQPWGHDCNGNQALDDCDVAAGISEDCNTNGTPDECEPDRDADGAIDDCEECPDDPAKVLAGQCGCHRPETDTDGDGAADCIDVDDDNDGVPDAADTNSLDPDVCGDVDGDGCDDCTIGTDDFGPLPDNNPANDGLDGDRDGLCDSGVIPAASTWGLAIAGLVLLTLGKLYFGWTGKRRPER